MQDGRRRLTGKKKEKEEKEEKAELAVALTVSLTHSLTPSPSISLRLDHNLLPCLPFLGSLSFCPRDDLTGVDNDPCA